MNSEKDTAVLFGKEVPLNFTSSRKFCIPKGRKEGVEVEAAYQITLNELPLEERGKELLKLHTRQYVHTPMIKLKVLMEDAGVWKTSTKMY